MEKIKIKVEVNPTEDVIKVRQAVENIFVGLDFKEVQEGEIKLLIAYGEDSSILAKFAHILKRERIRDAARTVLYQGITENAITFFLNKQVASAGHISFCEPVGESPLGPIRVRINSGNPRELIEWLAPKTP
jgi:predicted RNA binding protein with dsRBD fold (UPF0201 family)